MPKSMFSGFDKKETTKKIHTFNEHCVYPIVKSDMLLSSLQREKIISDIKTLVDAPDAHFDALYKQLIDKFAEFVQILPANNEARLGSLLDEGLLRALFAVQILKGKKGEDIDPILTYVFFSAGLLFDIGSVLEDRTIIISERGGSYVRQWYPHEGSMLVSEGYYKIRRGGGYPPWLCRRVTPVIARQIMPEIAFSWIAKNALMFDLWIALLNYEREAIGEFIMYFDRALELLEELKAKQELYAKLTVDIEEVLPKETELAEDFIAWLKEALAKGKLEFNTSKADIHGVEEGLLLNIKDLFEKFQKSSAGSKSLYTQIDLEELINQMTKLGLTNGVTMHYLARTAAQAGRPALGMFTQALFHETKIAGAGSVSEAAKEGAPAAAAESAKTTEPMRTVEPESRAAQIASAGAQVPLDGIVIHSLVEGFSPGGVGIGLAAGAAAGANALNAVIPPDPNVHLPANVQPPVETSKYPELPKAPDVQAHFQMGTRA